MSLSAFVLPQSRCGLEAAEEGGPLLSDRRGPSGSATLPSSTAGPALRDRTRLDWVITCPSCDGSIESDRINPQEDFLMKRIIASVLGTCLIAAAGCSAPPAPPLISVNQADFINGNFESGDLSGWSVQTNLNVGLGVVPPTQLAELNLQTGGINKTSLKSGLVPESMLAAGLQAGDTLMYPRFGQYSVVVNELGANRNANHLTQTMTTKAADIDPVDGKIHVRFCLAPVLQNPVHVASQQPYFYLEVKNTTQNKTLFSSFNFGGQAGVPWKSSGGGSVQYTQTGRATADGSHRRVLQMFAGQPKDRPDELRGRGFPCEQAAAIERNDDEAALQERSAQPIDPDAASGGGGELRIVSQKGAARCQQLGRAIDDLPEDGLLRCLTSSGRHRDLRERPSGLDEERAARGLDGI